MKIAHPHSAIPVRNLHCKIASLLAAGASIALLSHGSIRATTIEWANVGSTFSTGANWLGGTAPADSTVTDIGSFGSTGGAAVNPDLSAANRSINGISFLSGAFAYTFGSSTGKVLTIGTGGIVDSATNTETFGSTFTIATSASQTWTSNSGASLVFNGVVDINRNAATARTLTLNGAGDYTFSSSSVIQNSFAGSTGNLIYSGTGTLTLNGANTYTGTTTVGSSNGADAGTLKLSWAGVISNAATTVFGGTLDLNGTTQTITTLSLGGGASGSTATVAIGAGELKLGGTVTYSSSNDPNGATISGIGGGKLSLNGTRQFAVGNASATNDLTVSAIIQDGSTSSGLTKAGPGTLVLSGANTYTGKTSIVNGTLSVSSLNSVSGGSASSNLGAPTTVANGTIDLGAGVLGTLLYTGTGETTDRVINLFGTTAGGRIDQSGTGLLKFTSDLTATGLGAKVLTLQGSTSGTGEIAGAIVDSGVGATSLTKDGTGTWTLSGTNTYTGNTTVNGGKLLINGSTSSSSAVTVNSGGTLGGTGTIGGNITVNGGTLSPGTSPGILHTGAVTLESNSTFHVDINGTTPGTDYSQLISTGTVILNSGDLDITVGGTLNVGDTFAIVQSTGAVSGEFAQGNSISSGGYNFGIAYNANNVTLTVSSAPVPEPSTWIGGALAVAALAYTQRRRFTRLLRKA